MGFYTNITISNDNWHEIVKDPKKLVQGIGIAMNYGMNSPLSEMIDKRSNNEHIDRHRYEIDYHTVPQGVIVHKARHADEPQVIINTYGLRAVNAAEIPTAISFGWLDENTYNEEHAESIARELHRLAASIRHEAREAKKRKKETGHSRDQRLDRPARPSKGA